MTRAVYLLGGAGTGKSTFTEQLLAEIGLPAGPLVELWSKRNAKAVVTLRGHWLADEGLYLGVLRDSFPGTDGLDRASSLTGEEWLLNADLPRFIVAEGATLATRRFLGALNQVTELLLVHLHADDDTKRERFAQRGSQQAESFWKGTATRAANRLAEAQEAGVSWLSLDTADPVGWDLTLDLVRAHLLREQLGLE